MAVINESLIADARKGVEKREPSYTVGGNINWYDHYGKQYENRKTNIELTYDPAIPLLGTYPDKTLIHKKMHAPLCALQHYSQKQRHGSNLNIHLIDEWIKKMLYIYTMEYHLPIKKN